MSALGVPMIHNAFRDHQDGSLSQSIIGGKKKKKKKKKKDKGGVNSSSMQDLSSYYEGDETMRSQASNILKGTSSL